MKIVLKHASRDFKIEYLQYFFYIALIICYFFLTQANNSFKFDIQLDKSLLSVFLIVIVIKLAKYAEDDFIYFIYQITVALIFTGECVYYQCVPNSRIECLLASFIFLLMLILTQNIKFKIPNEISNERNNKLLWGLIFLFFIPYTYANIGHINLNNLLLHNIYDTRLAYREINRGILFIGYITPILARVALPFLICESLKRKQWLTVVICTCMVLMIFLCGAVKSILFGLISVFVFYSGSYEEKIKRFYIGVTTLVMLGIIVWLFNSYLVIDYLRRIFFTPANLENIYVNFFTDNYTYMAHSRLSFGLLDNTYGSSLSSFVGQDLLGRDGLNANIGALVEGFVSFGYLGEFLFALFLSLIFQFFKSEHINPIYAGIFFSYIYIMNTSFLHTLLATHGLIFLIVFSCLFMQLGHRNFFSGHS